MVGNGQKLYTVNEDTGVATRVGSVDNFGLGSNPAMSALASDGTTLWGVGTVADALFTINTTTGVATKVGSATAFDASITFPVALVYHKGKLYVAGQTTKALYELNKDTGVATRIGNATDFGIDGLSPAGFASDGTTLFMTSHRNAFYSINVSDGTATRIGNETTFGVSPWPRSGRMTSLASDGTTLWGALWQLAQDAVNLYTINKTTGVATAVGTQIRFGISSADDSQGGRPEGLAWLGAKTAPKDGDMNGGDNGSTPTDPVDTSTDPISRSFLTTSEINQVRIAVSTHLTQDDLSDDIITSPIILDSAIDYVFAKVKENMDLSRLTQDQRDDLDNISSFTNTVFRGSQARQFRIAVILRAAGNLSASYQQVLSESAISLAQRYETQQWDVKQQTLYLRADEIINLIRSEFDDDAFLTQSEAIKDKRGVANYILFATN